MARQRQYTYYFEPRGNYAYSNEILAKNIDGENALQEVPCSDGKKRNLWRCPAGMAFTLWASRHNWGKDFRIRVFCQEGKGKIRDITGKPPFPYGKPGKRKKKPKPKQ